MSRRQSINSTKIQRLNGIVANNAWVSYICIKCHTPNFVSVGKSLVSEDEAVLDFEWVCTKCNFIHSIKSGLPVSGLNDEQIPFGTWPIEYITPGSISAQRFWRAFFRMSVSNSSYYWKQCNVCGRILPSTAFDRHVGWGPLEKQMECRSCKAAINTTLNPLRTKQQLHESSVKRRAAELLLAGENKPVDIRLLFKRFNSRCFKTGKVLDIEDRRTYAIDHILPSRWLYPLNQENAALLSAEVNNSKSDKWPSVFYTNKELISLSQITGADLALISSKEPIINVKIDVNACVSRMLIVRDKTDLSKRVAEIHKLLTEYNLMSQLTDENKKILGY